MVDVEAQTECTLPVTVVGVEKDVMFGVRVRKSFGSRAFWGTVVGCYWVSGGLFYKVSFDDGDVDIFSADEVLQDAQAAKKHAKENPQQQDKETGDTTAVDDYFRAMRLHKLKRKRDDTVDNPPTIPNIQRVSLWGQRLYASIYTNLKNETFIKDLLKTDDGQMGEMEATGRVQVGDMILAVNETRVLGMSSRDLAELIRKPKRPIILTFYRPLHSQLPAEQQKAQNQQTQQSPATSSTPTPTTQPVPAPHPPTTVPASAPASVVMPPSFVPHPALAQARPMAQNLAQQWTNASQPLSNKEIIRQRLSQNAAARHASYVPGYPRGVYVPANAGIRTVPPAHSGAYQAQQQFMQRVVNSAAMRVTSGYTAPGIQPARPINQPQISTTAAQHIPANQRRTGLTLYEKVQQLQAQRNSVAVVGRPSSEPSRSQTAVTSRAQEIDLSLDEPEQGTASSLPDRTQQNAPTASQQTPHSAPTSDRRSTTNAPALVSFIPSTGTSRWTSHDAETIAKLAEKDPMAAQRLMKTAAIPTTSFLSPNEAPADTEMEDSMSFLSPSAATDTSTERETPAASHGMSFLSPNDFNVESSTPSRPENSSESAMNKPKSNVSLVSVEVSRKRLYLTLGVQGTLIAVTSFVSDEFGRPGEVEQSGKVFLGDVLVRINHMFILPGMTPNHVADIVNTSPRPMTLWFERASWEILDGKA
ncbi:hypothetical protein F442_05723 [Phytophthora nicotianae P10297]|uniref:PDZ domain-containing protein n=4 Tax=Phytophthora nicotianae TaxID=4792 RepID=W2QDX7_PHYN3|nr:hypothetical protein PPTG_10278 [Phytophthora nicotianae INRA-310]ETK90750.1 hypothetical protein L915_05539 [Phytophthora nicotianae]ETO79589.1 hypothetical protein F444_05729 [Phytophthora nicotianae P1976]ETP48567.1 hypothetical protein F442_05723 [Phytophthora nicotianae P10297]ETL97335.1 hypothetical protein L917_05366 [Phytophthora nicotianae]ETN11383.1 hypothetical protein PPTG_10278 [Phytophthora nicotianae INRA-310]